MTLALYDFDATLTTRDTMWEFISFCHPRRKVCLGYVAISPWLFLLAIKLISAEMAKKKVLSVFFNGWTRQQLEDSGERFCAERLPLMMNSEIFRDFEARCRSEEKVCIVTASCEPWVAPFAAKYKCDLICTRLLYTNEIFNGAFSTPNCNREEKAVRILKEYNLSDFSFIIAYGNRGSDDAMLKLAHERRII